MRRHRFLLAGLAALAAAALADVPLSRGAAAYPGVCELPSTPFALQDAAAASTGNRALGADAAWIQLLQYAADGIPELPSPPDRPLSRIKDMSLRVARLDPAFHRAYLFGASILGWDVNRPDEAVEVLQEALRRDPGQPLYGPYLAALAFQKKGDVDKMVALLERMVEDPRAPWLIKPILANIYKKRGEYAKSIQVWERVLDDANAGSEHARARGQIAEMRAKLKS